MSCEHVLNLLSAHVDGELGERERAEVDEHLASCASCRAERERVARTAGELSALFETVTASAPPLPLALARAAEPSGASRRPRLIGTLVAAAAAVVLLFALTQLDERTPDGPDALEIASRLLVRAASSAHEEASVVASRDQVVVESAWRADVHAWRNADVGIRGGFDGSTTWVADERGGYASSRGARGQWFPDGLEESWPVPLGPRTRESLELLAGGEFQPVDLSEEGELLGVLVQPEDPERAGWMRAHVLLEALQEVQPGTWPDEARIVSIAFALEEDLTSVAIATLKPVDGLAEELAKASQAPELGPRPFDDHRFDWLHPIPQAAQLRALGYTGY